MTTTARTAGSTDATLAGPGPETARGLDLDPGLALRQLAGILRLELRRNLLSRRALTLYVLALLPVGLMVVWMLSPVPEEWFSGPADAATRQFAVIFEGYLRTSVFLSTLLIFMSLFRAEFLERSLHFYFLTPVRREVLVAGKYLAALGAAATVFVASTAALFLFSCLPWGVGETFRYLFQGPGLGNLLAYLGIAVLACAGYGAVFLLVGQLFRNALIPGVVIWAWELVNFLLPPMLKKLSVIFYLQSLYPVPPTEGMVAVVADPISPWLSVPGLLLFTAAVLALAGWRAKRMEVTYRDD